MRSLYEINADLAAIIEYDGLLVNEETGEVVDEQALNALQLEREEKIEGVGLGVKNMRAEAAAIDAEIAALQSRSTDLKKKADGYEGWIAKVLAGEKFRTPRLDVSFRKSVAVIVANDAQLPAEYQTVKTEVKPDKIALKKALQNGESIPGCSLQQNLNITIK